MQGRYAYQEARVTSFCGCLVIVAAGTAATVTSSGAGAGAGTGRTSAWAAGERLECLTIRRTTKKSRTSSFEVGIGKERKIKKDEAKKKTQRDKLQTHDVYRSSQSFHFTYYSDYLLAWHLACLGICLTTSARLPVEQQDGRWQLAG